MVFCNKTSLGMNLTFTFLLLCRELGPSTPAETSEPPRLHLLEQTEDGLNCKVCLQSFWYKNEAVEHLKVINIDIKSIWLTIVNQNCSLYRLPTRTMSWTGSSAWTSLPGVCPLA